ncbi:hypothetical protein VTN96DRAFT_4957 [Rasamsonia emersonii]
MFSIKDDGDEVASIVSSIFERPSGSLKISKRAIGNVLMELRKCCIHPYLLEDVVSERRLGHRVITASGKFVVLYKLIEHLVIGQGKKVLIFSGFDNALNGCEDLLHIASKKQARFGYLRLDGSTLAARRNLYLYLFRTDPFFKVFLIATRAGGEGVSLTSASEVVFLDLDWNPQSILQAEARAHRIGQTQPVTVYKICTHGTVEEQMMSRLAKRLYLSSKITEKISNTVIQSIEPEEPCQSEYRSLASLIRRQTQTLPCDQTDPEDMLSWSWEKIVETCEARTAEGGEDRDKEKFPITEDEEREWLERLERVETCLFNGVKVPRSSHKRPIEEDFFSFLDPSERRIGKNRTVLIAGYHVGKESLECRDDEAVPTMAGKDPRLADPKKEKRPPFRHQKTCLVCGKCNRLEKCQSCPRVYHVKCVKSHEAKSTAYTPVKRNLCSQHNCCSCQHTASEAGGLLFCCRSCHRAFCEDCLEWESTTFVGDEIPEFRTLDYHSSSSTYYVICEHCNRASRKSDKRRVRQDSTLASKRAKRGSL